MSLVVDQGSVDSFKLWAIRSCYQRYMTHVQENPLDLKGLLNFLVVTTMNITESPEDLMIVSGHVEEVFAKVIDYEMKEEAAVQYLVDLQSRELNILERLKGTEATAVYLQKQAAELFSQITAHIIAIMQGKEDPADLMGYQKALCDLYPHLSEQEDISQYLLGYSEIQDTSSMIEGMDHLISDMDLYQKQQEELTKMEVEEVLMLKQLESCDEENLEKLKEEMAELNERYASLKEVTPPLRTILEAIGPCLLCQQTRMGEVPPLLAIQKQLKIMNCVWKAHLADIFAKRKLVQKGPEDAESFMGIIIQTFSLAKQSRDGKVEEIITEMIQIGTGQYIQASQKLGLLEEEEELSECMMAVQRWVVDMQALVNNLEKIQQEIPLRSVSRELRDDIVQVFCRIDEIIQKQSQDDLVGELQCISIRLHHMFSRMFELFSIGQFVEYINTQIIARINGLIESSETPTPSTTPTPIDEMMTSLNLNAS